MENTLDVMAASSTAVATNKPAFSLKSLNLAKSCPGIVVIETGTKISKYPFPKVKFEEGRRRRIALLTEDCMGIKLHYHPEVGYIICDNGACCKYCDKISTKYCYPCIVYETNEAGKPISTKVDVSLLVLGGELYDQISLLKEISGSITSVDLIFSCTTTQYQKCQVTQASAAVWQTNADVVKYVTDYMTNNSEHMLDAIGRSYTAEELAVKLGDDSGLSSDMKALSTDDVADVFSV